MRVSKSLSQLAVNTCVNCRGTGALGDPSPVVCECVYRVIFRRCYLQFRRCVLSADSTRPIPLERHITTSGKRNYGWARRNEEYCADFEIAARQALSPELHQIFRWHYVLGASARVVSERLGVHRRILERTIDDLQTAVGRQIAHCTPYSIYPPSEYMQPGSRATA